MIRDYIYSTAEIENQYGGGTIILKIEDDEFPDGREIRLDSCQTAGMIENLASCLCGMKW